MATNDSLARLLNLYLLLANTSMPLTLEEITREIGGFPPTLEARRQAFERAKRDLRSLGLPIVTTRSSESSADGYFVDAKSASQLAPSLTPLEALALAGAMASVRFGNDAALDSASKIGCLFVGEVAELATVPKVPAVATLFEVIQAKKMVKFIYRERERHLCPYGVIFRWGNWYLVGQEVGTSLVKSFRVDNIDGEVSVLETPCRVPAEIDVAKIIPDTRASIDAGEPEVVQLRFRKAVKDTVTSKLPPMVLEEVEGDFLTGTVEIGTYDAFLKVVSDFLEVIEVLGPEAVRARIADSFAAAVMAQEEVLSHPRTFANLSNGGETTDPKLEQLVETSRSESGALAQFRLVMSILPWLYRNPCTTTGEIARLFGIDPRKVGAMLERVACCGLPPFTPDRLIEIIVDGEEIQARVSDEFASGLSLTSEDRFIVALSAKLALAAGDFDGRADLESALKKIFSADEASAVSESIVIDIEGDRNFEAVKSATDGHRQLSFSYFSTSKSELTERRVDPFVVFSNSAYWYLRGWCHRSRGVRNFRLDRMENVVILDQVIEMQPSAQDFLPSTFSIDQQDFARGKSVVVEVKSKCSWRIADLPFIELNDDENPDTMHLAINVISDRWLSKLIAASSGEVVVVNPVEVARVVRDNVLSMLTQVS